MSKLPYMKFFHADWLTDTQPLSPAARGLWIDLICLLWRTTPRGVLMFSEEQWCRMLRCDITVLVTVLEELESFAICDITKTDNGDSNVKITISSRRIVKDEKDRLSNNLRQSTYRSKHRVNVKVTDDIRESNPYISDIRSHSSEVIDQNYKNKTTTPLRELDVEFEQFWKAYPRKVGGKKNALKAWGKAKDRPSIVEIIAAIEKAKLTDQWIKDNGQFIPHPATWLNQGRWADEPTITQPKSLGLDGTGRFVIMSDGTKKRILVT